MNTTTRKAKKPKAGKPLPPAIPPLPIRRFTVDEYHRMVEIGVLKDREPYELIHGWIVQKMVVNPPHSYAINALNELFGLMRGPKATVRIQQPITTTDSEPEPDVVLVYKIYDPSGNRTIAEMLAHTHHPLARPILAITLTYRSLRRNRSSIHTDWEKKLRMVQN